MSLLGDLECTGEERSLLECARAQRRPGNGGDTGDSSDECIPVAVRCDGKLIKPCKHSCIYNIRSSLFLFNIESTHYYILHVYIACL